MVKPGSWIKNDEDKKQKTRKVELKPRLTYRPLKGNPALQELLRGWES